VGGRRLAGRRPRVGRSQPLPRTSAVQGHRAALGPGDLRDRRGGRREINAFTTKEYTCYYARVLDADLPLAADVITDVVAAALIRPEDVESERGVILEEIAMTDDDPGDIVHDEFALALFGDTPLGRPIAAPPTRSSG